YPQVPTATTTATATATATATVSSLPSALELSPHRCSQSCSSDVLRPAPCFCLFGPGHASLIRRCIPTTPSSPANPLPFPFPFPFSLLFPSRSISLRPSTSLSTFRASASACPFHSLLPWPSLALGPLSLSLFSSLLFLFSSF